MHWGLIWGIIFLITGIALLITKMQHHDYNQTTNIAGVVFIATAIIAIVFSFIRIVPAGTVGVVDLFGRVSDTIRQPGLNMVNPFAKLEIMNVKTEQETELLDVPSKEGLSIILDTTILYSLNPAKATEIYKTVGVGYRDLVVIPQFRSACRGVTVNYEAKGLYTSGREEIAHKIFTDLKGMLEERGVLLEKVLLRSIKLPSMVSQAIEVKLRAEQEAEQMKFVLQKERQEAERKVVEAEGIAKAQEIINKTLTTAYLQHEAIQAQMKMASSPNHTTVYIPSGDNGIPLVRILEDNPGLKK
ncbi:MAG: prohibitin family protein [Candidatus Omnitrophica bacterium]|nr:prohibitin family protein [Candidatus Omnitrophota bacterium]